MDDRWEKFKRKYTNKDLVNLTDFKNDHERAKYFVNILIDIATGGNSANHNDDYTLLRSYFMETKNTREALPSWVIDQRDLSQFWHFIKHSFRTYANRREFIYAEFSALFTHLESFDTYPIKDIVSDVLLKFDPENIHRIWSKALERKNKDPDGAITIARTLLESVCKHILDTLAIEYDDKKIELPKLYKETALSLKLDTTQHEETIFKIILGGCSAIVNGLGSLRNQLGDSHGKSKTTKTKPSTRHSELAVNLAGSMALFLIRTLERNLEKI